MTTLSSCHRPLRLLLTSLALLSTIVFPGSAVLAAGQETYLDQIKQAAVQQELHRERTWEVLLHYTRTLTGAYKSRIDDPAFFLSSQGRTDPQGELAATLDDLFVPRKDGAYTACRFPARYEWLTSRLGIDTSRLPSYSCTERDKALASVSGRSAVLVFPVGHINSPASMFGHTLIRIDSSSKSSLISYAGNYAASTSDTNGFVYAWKGLTGGYKGYYSLMPYYLKVKEYNDLEHRDMWEYPLRLSETEVRRMLDHFWELQNIKSSYYFIDENCSFNLLFLIEAARPELRLVEKTGIYVLPTQTIGIARDSGILEEPKYRPSQGTRIRNTAALLDRNGQQVAHDLAYGRENPGDLLQAPYPREQKMEMLDSAVEFLQYRLSHGELSQDAFSKSYLALLEPRSRLGEIPEGLYRVPVPSHPESGHPGGKATAGLGVRRGEGFAELELRPALHSLLDPDQGFLPGSQIEFFDAVLDYRIPAQRLRLRSLHLVDIVSISPQDIFFKPLSWKVNTGLDTEALANGRDYLIYRLNTGGGLATVSPFGGIWYGFAEVDLDAGEKLRAGFSLAPGVSAGALEQITDWWKLQLSASGFLYRLGDDRSFVRVTAGQNFRLGRRNSASTSYGLEFVNGHRIEDAKLIWNYYF